MANQNAICSRGGVRGARFTCTFDLERLSGSGEGVWSHRILVDDSQSKLYCFYTRWVTGTHIGINPIEYRVANYNTLVFGLETSFIDSPTVEMNNIQSTKQALPSQL